MKPKALLRSSAPYLVALLGIFPTNIPLGRLVA